MLRQQRQSTRFFAFRSPRSPIYFYCLAVSINSRVTQTCERNHRQKFKLELINRTDVGRIAFHLGVLLVKSNWTCPQILGTPRLNWANCICAAD